MVSLEDRQFLLKLARTAISDYIKGIETKTSRELGKHGVFVTLTLGSNLRGCVGYTEPAFDLVKGVVKAAKAAAFGDPRFAPLSEEELNYVKIEISILTEPKPIKFDKIVIGKHGLIIDYNRNNGLLLPQVAKEHNMSKEEFLNALCDKAGLPKNTWKKKEAELYGFEAEIFKED